ncbi:GlcG/HbpS family heme-binding protein [Nocardia rhamnosiphila]
MNITLAHAEQAIARAKARADELGVRASIAVVDSGGHLIAFARQDDAILVSLDMAIGKAYTAVAMRAPTSQIAAAVQPGAPFYHFDLAHHRPLVAFAGGHPIGNPLAGAIGVSGGTAEQDDEIALAGITAPPAE